MRHLLLVYSRLSIKRLCVGSCGLFIYCAPPWPSRCDSGALHLTVSLLVDVLTDSSDWVKRTSPDSAHGSPSSCAVMCLGSGSDPVGLDWSSAQQQQDFWGLRGSRRGPDLTRCETAERDWKCVARESFSFHSCIVGLNSHGYRLTQPSAQFRAF